MGTFKQLYGIVQMQHKTTERSVAAHAVIKYYQANAIHYDNYILQHS